MPKTCPVCKSVYPSSLSVCPSCQQRQQQPQVQYQPESLPLQEDYPPQQPESLPLQQDYPSQQTQMQTCPICSTVYPVRLTACPTCTLDALQNQNDTTQKVNVALVQLRAALAEARVTNPKTVNPSVPPPVPMQQQFNGSGQKVTPPFILSPGLARFQLSHNGRRHFGVWLIDAGGNRISLLANTTGKFNGSKALGIKFRGQYLLNVEADGGWVIHVQQP
jgi:RNA polymerase subunit RPABC4/transcription elongation factor Spt4